MEKTYSVETSILSYLDHRLYLGDVEKELREKGVFSHRRFNRDCGFSSPNFLQLVIQGKRNLSEDGARRVCETLGLSKDETRLFLKMMSTNLEMDPVRRTTLLQELLREPSLITRHHLTQAQLSYYVNWYNVPIRELIQAYPTLTPPEIAVALLPSITISQAEESLQTMRDLGLIEATPNGWRALHNQIASGNEVLHYAVRSFHTSMIRLAGESIERVRAAEREISSATMRLTDAEFVLLKEKIREFKKEALKLESGTTPARVYQFNFQLFPLTLPLEEKES